MSININFKKTLCVCHRTVTVEIHESTLRSPGRSPRPWSPQAVREGWRCVFLHLNLRDAQSVQSVFASFLSLHFKRGLPFSSWITLHNPKEYPPLPSDMSSSSRRLMPISCEGALRLSVGVGNSGKDGGDWGDVSNPDRSNSAVPPPERNGPVHFKLTKTKTSNSGMEKCFCNQPRS